MRALLTASMALVAVGCFGLEEALQTERQPVSPPGIAPVEDMTGVAPQAAPAQAAPGQEPVAAEPRKPFIGRTTARVVDYHQAMADNPNLVVAENRVTGNDPLTVAASAYVSATSRASAANFEHQLKIMREFNDGRYPTYEEYMDTANQMRIHFAELPPFQMYAYDSQTGGIVILEDPEDKARRYREAGIQE